MFKKPGNIILLSFCIYSFTAFSTNIAIAQEEQEHHEMQYQDDENYMMPPVMDYQGRGMHEGGGMHMMMDDNMPMKMHGISKLLNNAAAYNLTKEQVKTIQGIMKEKKKNLIKLEAEKETLQLDLHDLVHEKKPDRSKINKLLEDMGSVSNKMRNIKINSFLNALDVLDEKQREDFMYDMQSNRMMMRQMMRQK